MLYKPTVDPTWVLYVTDECHVMEGFEQAQAHILYGIRETYTSGGAHFNDTDIFSNGIIRAPSKMLSEEEAQKYIALNKLARL